MNDTMRRQPPVTLTIDRIEEVLKPIKAAIGDLQEKAKQPSIPPRPNEYRSFSNLKVIPSQTELRAASPRFVQ